jgi:hypothetical protein
MPIRTDRHDLDDFSPAMWISPTAMLGEWHRRDLLREAAHAALAREAARATQPQAQTNLPGDAGAHGFARMFADLSRPIGWVRAAIGGSQSGRRTAPSELPSRSGSGPER